MRVVLAPSRPEPKKHFPLNVGDCMLRHLDAAPADVLAQNHVGHGVRLNCYHARRNRGGVEAMAANPGADVHEGVLGFQVAIKCFPLEIIPALAHPTPKICGLGSNFKLASVDGGFQRAAFWPPNTFMAAGIFSNFLVCFGFSTRSPLWTFTMPVRLIFPPFL
jgi:hypothetical protein